eukprot:m.13042 g.13042  ORF g.13042 m.13042 type:complete len:495 (-) comp7406_c0_seq1:197-1681(-)
MSSVQWTLGLKNRASGKYITQEAFGNAVNCNGGSLRKKQTMTMIAGDDGTIHLKTCNGKFLYGNRDGKVMADLDEPSAETQWTIVPQPSGTWGLISAAGYFFHGTGSKLTCFTEAKEGVEVPADGHWVVHLAMHPQINLFSPARKAFVHFAGDALTTDEDVPWGDDALLSLVFFDDAPDGRYGICSFDGKFLESSGKLVDEKNPNCEFHIDFHDDNKVSFRASNGNYLSPSDAVGTLKAHRNKIGKDQYFLIQDSEPQFTINTELNSGVKQLSARNGNEIKADQTDVTDFERFQLMVNPGGKVFIKTSKLTYFTVRDDSSIGGVETSNPGESETFTIDYSGENRVKFVSAKTGNPLWAKPSGALFASSSDVDTVFTLTIINRPTLLLRCQYGFAGLKGASGRVECNKAAGNFFKLTTNDGFYFLQSEQTGKYWGVDQDGLTATYDAPEQFVIEFVEPTNALIKHVSSGKYLKASQNGAITNTGNPGDANTLFEY